MRNVLILLISLLLFSGCKAKTVYLKPALEEGGEVFLYMQPFPQEAERLRFNLERVSALKSDNMEYPLSISLSGFKGSEIKRQRLAASGQMPPGRYTGFLFKVKDAFLRGEEGEANLLVQEDPITAAFTFDVRKGEATLLYLEFKYAQSIREGFGFSPLFFVFMPDRPVSGLVGYVANRDSDNITVFDKKSLQVIDVIVAGRGPGGIAIDEKRRRAYVALSGDESVGVVDVATGRVLNSIRLNPGDNPKELALTPDGNLLLTANTGSDTVSIIDPFSLMEMGRVNVGDGPNSILIDRKGLRAYAFNLLSNTISVIDIPSRTVAGIISTEYAPIRGQFNRLGDRLYVIHERAPYMTVIDPLSLSVRQRVFVGMGASSIKVDTMTDLIHIGKRHEPTIDVYDQFASVPVASIDAGGGVVYMTIDGEKNNLLIVIPSEKVLRVIDLVSKKTVSEMDLGDGPYWVSIMGER